MNTIILTVTVIIGLIILYKDWMTFLQEGINGTSVIFQAASLILIICIVMDIPVKLPTVWFYGPLSDIIRSWIV